VPRPAEQQIQPRFEEALQRLPMAMASNVSGALPDLSCVLADLGPQLFAGQKKAAG
jgi:hypothetical protein